MCTVYLSYKFFQHDDVIIECFPFRLITCFRVQGIEIGIVDRDIIDESHNNVELEHLAQKAVAIQHGDLTRTHHIRPLGDLGRGRQDEFVGFDDRVPHSFHRAYGPQLV